MPLFKPFATLLLMLYLLLTHSIGLADEATATLNDAAGTTPPKTVLVWGDSLSAAYGIPVESGWVNLLQTKLGSHFKVVNGSISGETTVGGLTRLPDALALHKPDYVLLELGANDGLRGLSPTVMQENLQKMIELSQQANASTVLIGIKIPPNYGPAYTQKFEQVFIDLAAEYKLAFVPFLLEGVALDYTLMQADGLHPTAEAQTLVLEHLWPTLEPVLLPANKPAMAATVE